MNAEEIKIILKFSAFMYAIMLLVCAVFFFRPPKNINRFYGYRTNKARKNLQNWRYANALAPKVLFYVIHLAVFFSLAMLYWLRHKVSLDAMFLINLFWFAIFPIIIVPVVEYKLGRFEVNQNSGQA